MTHHRTLSHLITFAFVASTAMATAIAADEVNNLPSASVPSAINEKGAYVGDANITTQVKSALNTNKISGISVTTELGVVILSGSVVSEELRQQATIIAAAIEGVKGVSYASLVVKPRS